MSKHGKILVAMSGGIDSTVSALMLHNQGYEVIGITMKTWDYSSSGGSKKETGCCSLDSINDARDIAVRYGFHHIILDIREEFGEHIITNFVDEYLAGRTPNPCILCNTHIKWEALLKRAKQLDCEYLATGHYAQIRQENSRLVVSKGVDNTKDQSYVLWGVSQENLKHTKFPLGRFTKEEIKQIAIDNDMRKFVEKNESFEICFIPDNDYRGFLNRKVPGLQKKMEGGTFISADGKVLGEHKGFPYYTIGQRKGLGIVLGEPMYVTKILPETNTIILGPENELNRRKLLVRNPNFIKIPILVGKMEALTKIRYKDKGSLSTIEMNDTGDKVLVDFYDNVKSVTPGQSAVFYDNNDVIGGGFIECEN